MLFFCPHKSRFLGFYLKREEALCHVGEYGHYCSCQYAGDGWEDAAGLMKEGAEVVGEQCANSNSEEVADHLYPTADIGFRKHDIARHTESIGCGYHEGND